jgi:multiple sugar transport system substrate-binding protein
MLLVLAPLLAACGGLGSAGSTTTSANIPKSELCPGKKPPANLTVINWWESTIPGVLKSAQDFNCAHPDIAVNITVYPNVGDDSQGKLLAAVAGHKSPDLVLSYDDVLANWAAKGEIQPLDSQANAVGVKPSDFVQYAWQSVHWQGQIYGIPADWDPDTLLWYNKNVFKEAGLNPNNPPTTWEELMSDASKIDSIANGKIKRVGLVPWQGWLYNYVEYGHLYNADLQDGSSKGVKLNTPGMQQSLSWERSFAQKFGGASNVNSYTNVQNASGVVTDPLTSGRVGMEFTGDWELEHQAVLGASKFRNLVGVTSVPTPPGGQNYMSHSGWAFMIPKGSKNADATMQFVKWIMQDDNFVKYLGSPLGWMPAKLTTRQNSYYQSDPFWQAIFAANQKNGENYWLLPSPVLAQYYSALGNAESEVINLKKTPQQALVEADSVAQNALQAAITDGSYGGN